MNEEKNSNAALAKAYTQAWAEVNNVVKNAHNPAFKSNYADLGAVIDTVKEVFAKYDLALLQTPGVIVAVEGVLCQELHGVLMHSSGGTIGMKMMLPIGSLPKPGEVDKFGKPARGDITAQKAGGVITFARRYQLAAVGGIAQVDDDGNEASGRGSANLDSGSATPEKPDHSDLLRRVRDCTDFYELNGTGTGKGLKKSALRLEVEATEDKKVIDVFVARRDELKKTKDVVFGMSHPF